MGHPARFSKIFIGFADNVSKERQFKGYCLIFNERDSCKCALDYRNFEYYDLNPFRIYNPLTHYFCLYYKSVPLHTWN